MNRIKWAPFGGIDDIFGRQFDGLISSTDLSDRLNASNADYTWRPAADISETKKEYTIRAQLPGVRKEDVSLTFDQGTLTLQGERVVKKSDKDEKIHRTESFYGKYSRSFALPDDVDADQVKAHCKDGVLTVHLPKLKNREEHHARQITVE